MKPTKSAGRPRKPRPASLRGEVAERIEAVRKSRDMGQPELAAAAGIANGTLQAIEAGESRPALETIAAIARALGMSPAALLAKCPRWNAQTVPE